MNHLLFLGNLGAGEILLIALIVLLLFGGKKIPERDALEMAYRAVNEGAAGVDMGRNVLQAAAPKAMLRAIRMVVHENATPEAAHHAYELWQKDVD